MNSEFHIKYYESNKILGALFCCQYVARATQLAKKDAGLIALLATSLNNAKPLFGFHFKIEHLYIISPFLKFHNNIVFSFSQMGKLP